MKKLFFIASLMMLSLSTFAQHAPGTVSIQPKVGLNIANLTSLDNADPRLGLDHQESPYLFLPNLGAFFFLSLV